VPHRRIGFGVAPMPFTGLSTDDADLDLAVLTLLATVSEPEVTISTWAR
jgi:hypothetical protein